MKKMLAAALLLAAGLAAGALNAYRTGISLSHPVRLADGSVLPAGKYDVEIEYRGWGDAATLNFLQGGVLKGKAPAEARGFPATDPSITTATGQHFPKLEQKGEPPAVKIEELPEVKLKKVVEPGDDKVQKVDKWEKWDKVAPVGAPSFDWAHAGFGTPPRPGLARALGDGSVKLSFDSSNSAAGFTAILPFIERKGK